ncbi:MAG TPA: hypothetical protein VGT05_01510 [Patescibacteria group bacterium]|nr:hypothetical protein [Patescibacteria group bacterium]
MHKTFYASGFLYHLPSEQILLQQDTSLYNHASHWFLFCRKYTKNENPEEVFQKIIFDFLGIEAVSVQPVYSYENEHANQCIFYSELEALQNFSSKNGLTFKWFTFKDVEKLKIMEQTKHDIVVGQRVINAASRKRRGEHTFL